MSTQQSEQAANALGIDVSHFQATVNWQMVKTSGISFAFTKATEGTGEVDPLFTTNWGAMKEAGILRGAYHFFRPEQDAAQQASHFAQTVQLESGDLPPVIDLEVNDSVDNATLVEGVKTWLQVVEQQTGRTPMIYTNHPFWNQYMTDQFGVYPLWIAEYGVQHPIIPKGWTRWNFWQNSQNGGVAGVRGAVDLDQFNGSAADLMVFLQLPISSTETISPTPAVTPLTQAASVGEVHTYIVQPGDTLERIASRYGVTEDKLVNANNVDDPNLIKIGQALNIPE